MHKAELIAPIEEEKRREKKEARRKEKYKRRKQERSHMVKNIRSVCVVNFPVRVAKAIHIYLCNRTYIENCIIIKQ